MSPTVDVIIPVHGNYAMTSQCLLRLADQTAAHRVIVVDDISPDDTADRIAADWPSVTLLRLSHRAGYTGAVNQGVAAGDGEFVVLLNNDVELRPDCLSELTAPLARDPNLGSVAAAMFAPDGEWIDSVGVCIDPTLAGFARLRGRPSLEASSKRPIVAGPDGNAGAFRRSAWDAVGGFDTTIPAYLEVVDLALRLRSAGWSTAVAPKAQGLHHGSATFGRRSAGQRFAAGFSRGYMLRRWRVLLSRSGPRAIVTEGVVVLVDALIARDAVAARGRWDGWRAGRRFPRHQPPPAGVIDDDITFVESMRMRWATR
jgi:N-acetylglucosaminyl-diphospho-decaprenol L-rhamnosyltransferase